MKVNFRVTWGLVAFAAILGLYVGLYMGHNSLWPWWYCKKGDHDCKKILKCEHQKTSAARASNTEGK